MSNRQYAYESPLDIYSFFSSRDMVKEFLLFLFENGVKHAKLMEELESDKPAPFIFEYEISQYQVDYQFFIIIVGKWVAKITNDAGIIKKVVRDYCLMHETLMEKNNLKNRKGFAFFLSETLNLTSCRKKSDEGKASTPIDFFPSFIMKIVEHKGKPYDMKVIGLETYYLRHYIGIDEWPELEKNIKRYIFDIETKQVAFRKKSVDVYWAKHKRKTEEGRRTYFMIDSEDLSMPIDDLLEWNATN